MQHSLSMVHSRLPGSRKRTAIGTALCSTVQWRIGAVRCMGRVIGCKTGATDRRDANEEKKIRYKFIQVRYKGDIKKNQMSTSEKPTIFFFICRGSAVQKKGKNAGDRSCCCEFKTI